MESKILFCRIHHYHDRHSLAVSKPEFNCRVREILKTWFSMSSYYHQKSVEFRGESESPLRNVTSQNSGYPLCPKAVFSIGGVLLANLA
jgi:hypothetical protein